MAAQQPFDESTIRNLFGDCDFPVHRDALIEQASDEEMGSPFIKALQQLPKREYSDVDEINQVLNAPGEHRPRA